MRPGRRENISVTIGVTSGLGLHLAMDRLARRTTVPKRKVIRGRSVCLG